MLVNGASDGERLHMAYLLLVEGICRFPRACSDEQDRAYVKILHRNACISYYFHRYNLIRHVLLENTRLRRQESDV